MVDERDAEALGRIVRPEVSRTSPGRDGSPRVVMGDELGAALSLLESNDDGIYDTGASLGLLYKGHRLDRRGRRRGESRIHPVLWCSNNCGRIEDSRPSHARSGTAALTSSEASSPRAYWSCPWGPRALHSCETVVKRSVFPLASDQLMQGS